MKFLQSLICTSLIAMPLLANADNLNIANNTKSDLSFRVNNVCSDIFSVVPAHTIKVVSENDFNKACYPNTVSCPVMIYNHINCSGENIADIIFDKRIGVTSIQTNDTSMPIHVSGNGFNLMLSSPA